MSKRKKQKKKIGLEFFLNVKANVSKFELADQAQRGWKIVQERKKKNKMR